MNTPIEITINYSQSGYENNKAEILYWLHFVLPGIMKAQKAPADKIFLTATGETRKFYLS